MAIEARIADLVFRQLQDSLSAEEKLELQQWIDSSPQHKTLFDKYSDPAFFAEFWKKDTALMERARSLQQRVPAPVHHLRRPWLRYTAAASVIILIAMGAYFLRQTDKPLKPQKHVGVNVAKNDVAPGSNKATLTLADGSKIVLEKTPNGTLADQGNTKILTRNGGLIYRSGTDQNGGLVYNTLATNRGEEFPLTLSDGTKIWLNAASSIRFPVSFPGSVRHVEITGEVYFEVAQDPEKPFTVSLNGMEITVLGTHFNVNGYADETSVKTTLVEGAVMVEKGARKIVLAPGQQASLTEGGNIALIKDADIEKAVSWKEGYFHFDNNNLGAVMREISRWYDVDVIYEKESLKQEDHFSGDIEKSLTLAAVLRVLEKSQVHFRIEGQKLVVIP